MTDPIYQYEKLRKEQDRIEKELEALQEDKAFQKDMACKEKIKTLLEDHGKTLQDLLRLFPEVAPTPNKEKPASTRNSPGTKRPMKRYKHPETGEVVESRGLNKKELQVWIKEHGLETVKSWEDKKETSANTPTHKAEKAAGDSASTPTSEARETTT